MTTTEIREALRAVEQAVDVPTVDQVAFQARVRGERRRRTAGRALLGVAAAATLVAGGLTAQAVLDEPGQTQVAGPSGSDGPLSGTAFFVVDGRLTALEPDGAQHDLGKAPDAVVGWTSERLYLLDDGHLSVRSTAPPFEEVTSPVPGGVRGAALSGDGRYLAWIGGDDRVHRYDVKAEDEDVTLRVGADADLTGVSQRGVLVADDAGLTLRDGPRTVHVPVSNDGFTVDSTTARDLVLLNDSDGESVLFEVGEGPVAHMAETFTGTGVLGPYGERVAVIGADAAGVAGIQIWDGSMTSTTGLDGLVPTAARWAGETTLLVAGLETSGEPALYGCDIDLGCERLPVSGEVSFD